MREPGQSQRGFTLIEMAIGILMLGIVLIAFANIFALFQKSATESRQFATAQQNARVSIDHVTDILRQAGAGSDYTNGQQPVAHAGPYQVAVNADIDRGETLSGATPLTALIGPYAVTSIYNPPETYNSPAETVVFTLDSDEDGTISSSDHGDDPEESGTNTNRYILVQRSYGATSGTNQVHTSKLSFLRGPGQYPDNSHPQPLFKYLYDHDDDAGTADRLWGDSDDNGSLSNGEIAGLSPMPDALLGRIRKIQINAISESDQYNPKFESDGGYLSVEMRSQVNIRNATRLGSVIYGTVFHDINGDGTHDSDENGIPNVQIQLAGTGETAWTNGFGVYKFIAAAGSHSVQEIDPSGFLSTTANTVNVTVTDGQSKIVDFGDKQSGALGFIKGTVFEDLDENGMMSGSEMGIQGVTLSLGSGESDVTDTNGRYAFVVTVGSHDVIESDPVGMGSTTPNTVAATVSSAGDSAIVDFGDTVDPTQGVIEGYVFEDDNKNGVRDMGEGGIVNVRLEVSNGDTMRTNQSGFYSFSLDAGTYSINEVDPGRFVSTTLNYIQNLVVVPDTVIVQNFGDILDVQVAFNESPVANIDGAMSLCVEDFGEDANGDNDIIVGMHYKGGAGNVAVFHNEWRSSATPPSQIFSATPSYFRDAGQDVRAVATADLSADGAPDVMTGLNLSTGLNVQQWNNAGDGSISPTPDQTLSTPISTTVQSGRLADINNDGVKDIILGVSSYFDGSVGGVQIFASAGDGSFQGMPLIKDAGPNQDVELGGVWAIEAADFDGDGDLDLAVGSQSSPYTGALDLYENMSGGYFYWHSRYMGFGAINDIAVVDLMEDGNGDLDIVVAVSDGPVDGRVLIWLHNGQGFGQTGGVAVPYPATPAIPNHTWSPGGEVLTVEVAHINEDVFPDIFAGTRSSSFYRGGLSLAISGDFSDGVITMNSGNMGEVATLSLADFDRDGRIDVVAATKVSSTFGKLVVFYNESD